MNELIKRKINQGKPWRLWARWWVQLNVKSCFRNAHCFNDGFTRATTEALEPDMIVCSILPNDETRATIMMGWTNGRIIITRVMLTYPQKGKNAFNWFGYSCHNLSNLHQTAHVDIDSEQIPTVRYRIESYIVLFGTIQCSLIVGRMTMVLQSGVIRLGYAASFSLCCSPVPRLGDKGTSNTSSTRNRLSRLFGFSATLRFLRATCCRTTDSG